MIEILDFQPEHQPLFEKFNREWIERYFRMEDSDYAVLKNPSEFIINKGGAILMASFNNELAGTVALIYMDGDTFELSKFAVAVHFRGNKIGSHLIEAAIERVKMLHGTKIVLYTNTNLRPAIHLYLKFKFQRVPFFDRLNSIRRNVKMELNIPTMNGQIK